MDKNSIDFYDKVAKRFGSYKSGANYIKEFPNGDPEEVFKSKIIDYGGKNKIALDVGCADGRFTLSIANHFEKIYAIDLSKEMLRSAEKLKSNQSVKNVIFSRQDASKTTFADSFFHVVYCRRGPTFYPEFFRILKNQGYYVEIGIAEKDAIEIKKIFSRGQGFGKWNQPRLKSDILELEKAGFKIIYSQDFVYNEFYKTDRDLEIFLRSVPIFEDFDPEFETADIPEKDREELEIYCREFKADKGIKLSRHRLVLIARKS